MAIRFQEKDELVQRVLLGKQSSRRGMMQQGEKESRVAPRSLHRISTAIASGSSLELSGDTEYA